MPQSTFCNYDFPPPLLGVPPCPSSSSFSLSHTQSRFEINLNEHWNFMLCCEMCCSCVQLWTDHYVEIVVVLSSHLSLSLSRAAHVARKQRKNIKRFLEKTKSKWNIIKLRLVREIREIFLGKMSNGMSDMKFMEKWNECDMFSFDMAIDLWSSEQCST